MKKLKLILSFVGVFAFTISTLLAGELSRFSNIRLKSMGGAGIALVDKADSLYLNPAGLSRVSFVDIKFPRLRLETSQGILNDYQKILNLAQSSGNASDLSSSISGLVPLSGGISAQLSPAFSVAMKGLGVGVFSSSLVSLSIQRKTQPVVDITGFADVGMMFGMSTNLDFLAAKSSVGVTIKQMIRYEVFDPRTGNGGYKASTADLLKAANGTALDIQSRSLSGIGVNLGFLTGLEIPFAKGSFGIALNDIGTTLTGSGANAGVSTTIPLSGKVGVGLDVSIPPVPVVGGDITVAADYRLITPYNDFFKNLHIGLEKGILANIIKLRGGLNQGYVVGGIGFDLFIIHVNYGMFTEELGTRIGNEPVTFHMVEVGFLL